MRGGRLSSLSIDGKELLVGPPSPDDRSIRWGCFLMAPWPGRLANGRFTWRERAIQLPRTHGRHAIHGLLWGRPWNVEAVFATTASLVCELPRDEWPMGGRVRQMFTLTPSSLIQDAVIAADDPMPVALGWHPWFRRRGDVALRVDADAVLSTRRMLPVGGLTPVDGTSRDLRAGPILGRRRLDDVYVGVRRAPIVSWPDLTLRIETEPEVSTVVVYTPREALCVEPQTAWPNALGHDRRAAVAAGARFLARGQSLRASMMLTWG